MSMKNELGCHIQSEKIENPMKIRHFEGKA